jgi:hypothetical protein
LNNPKEWTAVGGFVCPLRHDTKLDPNDPTQPYLGFLIAGHGFKVYIGLMYFIDHADQLPFEQHDSAADVCAAGWHVD